MHALFLFGRLSLLNGFLAEQLELLRARCSRGIVCHVRARPVTVLLFRQKQQRNYWITLVPTHNGALIFHYFIWPKKISQRFLAVSRETLSRVDIIYFGGSTALRCANELTISLLIWSMYRSKIFFWSLFCIFSPFSHFTSSLLLPCSNAAMRVPLALGLLTTYDLFTICLLIFLL